MLLLGQYEGNGTPVHNKHFVIDEKNQRRHARNGGDGELSSDRVTHHAV